MDYIYGTKADEVDAFFREKRSWSRVKDKILSDYVTTYLKTVPHLRKPILIVDGFSGPGRFGDGSAGSPLLICTAIRATVKGRVGAKCLFADARLGHRNALELVLADYIATDLCEKPAADCAAVLERALQVGEGATVFYYLDPYGIKDIDFEMVRRIYQRDSRQSTELLLNFNFRTFMRMSGNWSYGDSATTIAGKVKEGKAETVDAVMGGDYWRAIVTDPTLDKIAREDAVISAYVGRLKQFFRYAFSIPVKERDESLQGVPEDELAHYHLIFGTRSPRAVQYMNDIALNALEPYFSQFKDGLLFDMTPDRYLPASRERAKNAIVGTVEHQPLTRPQIIEAVIPNLFMNYKVKDYREMINELTFNEGRLYPDSAAMKLRNKLNDETRLSANPWPGGLL